MVVLYNGLYVSYVGIDVKYSDIDYLNLSKGVSCIGILVSNHCIHVSYFDMLALSFGNFVLCDGICGSSAGLNISSAEKRI